MTQQTSEDRQPSSPGVVAQPTWLCVTRTRKQNANSEIATRQSKRTRSFPTESYRIAHKES
jgi:hypothetical protein